MSEPDPSTMAAEQSRLRDAVERAIFAAGVIAERQRHANAPTLTDEIAAEADRIEADYAKPHDPPWDPLDAEEARWGCDSAYDDMCASWSSPERRHHLVRLAAWALVALRASVRAAHEGGGHG